MKINDGRWRAVKAEALLADRACEWLVEDEEEDEHGEGGAKRLKEQVNTEKPKTATGEVRTD